MCLLVEIVVEAGRQSQCVVRCIANAYRNDTRQVGRNGFAVLVFACGLFDALVEVGFQGSHRTGDFFRFQRTFCNGYGLIRRHVGLLQVGIECRGKVAAQVADARKLVD